MTDEILLRTKINDSGYKLRYIAKRLGISYQALLNKIRNISDFRAPEIAGLCELLAITEEERTSIFFGTKVDK